MFSDRKDHRGFKPHTSHFFPWLRNGLKANQDSNLGLDGAYTCGTEPRSTLSPLGKAKGVCLLSKDLIQGKDKEKKGDARCNGVGLAKRLPVVLRGHHILPGSLGRQRGDSPARWKQPPEQNPDSDNPGDKPKRLGDTSPSVHDYSSEYSVVRSQLGPPNPPPSQTDRTSPPVRRYGPLLVPTPVSGPARPGKFKGQEPNCNAPVIVCMEEGREKTWHYARHTYLQRDLHSSILLNSAERQQGLDHSKERSQRDLAGSEEPLSVAAFNGPNSLHGVIFSTEVPLRDRDSGCSRKPRPSSECTLSWAQRSQTWSRSRPTSGGEARVAWREAGQTGPRCSRKAVRSQIKRVVANLEQVLGALKDVHQEMKEVVEQIDYLTSSIDLNEEEQGGRDGNMNPPSDSSSSSSGVTVGSNHQRPSDQGVESGSIDPSTTLRKGRLLSHVRDRSPPGVQPHTQNTVRPSERKTQTLPFTFRSLRSSPKWSGGPASSSHDRLSSTPSVKTGGLVESLTSQNSDSATCRTSPLPVRPPTPGLSPLTVNLHHPNSTPGLSSPAPLSHSPRPSSPIRLPPLSSQPSLLSAISPSVISETKGGSNHIPHAINLPASPSSPSSDGPPAPSCPPSDCETLPGTDAGWQASLTEPIQLAPQGRLSPTAATKPPSAQGCRGRKPPPYPHNTLFERTKKAKEPRKAPPYPEKRRLLSTTV
ncbi:proline-rich protein 36 [Lampris incognitus]|uniref:proline-rich protein 36 n=1 Tax=Lampris incognitus TaxID=2546036 RepID=UPI0024B507C9|nr:proline-rich protein 36 [Lampris incognitus]